MKKITVCIMVFLITFSSFSQQTDSSQHSVSTDYLTKSKNQRDGAWVLLGGGITLTGLGFLVGDRGASTFDEAATGGILIGLGVLATLGSIPLFIVSGHTKKKAMKVSAGLESQRNPIVGKTPLRIRSVPGISLKLDF